MEQKQEIRTVTEPRSNIAVGVADLGNMRDLGFIPYTRTRSKNLENKESVLTFFMEVRDSARDAPSEKK